MEALNGFYLVYWQIILIITCFYPEYLDNESELPSDEGGNLKKK